MLAKITWGRNDQKGVYVVEASGSGNIMYVGLSYTNCQSRVDGHSRQKVSSTGRVVIIKKDGKEKRRRI